MNVEISTLMACYAPDFHKNKFHSLLSITVVIVCKSEVMLNLIYCHLISYRDLIYIVCVQNKLNYF